MNTFKPSFFIRLFLIGVCAVAVAEKGFSKAPVATQEQREEIQELLRNSFDHLKHPKIRLQENEKIGLKLLAAHHETLVNDQTPEVLEAKVKKVLEQSGLQLNESAQLAYYDQSNRDLESIRHPLTSFLKDLVKDLWNSEAGIKTFTHGVTTDRMVKFYAEAIMMNADDALKKLDKLGGKKFPDENTKKACKEQLKKSIEQAKIYAYEALKSGVNKRLQDKLYTVLRTMTEPTWVTPTLFGNSKKLIKRREALLKFIVHATQKDEEKGIQEDPTTRQKFISKIATNWTVAENQKLNPQLRKEVGKAFDLR